MSSPHFDIDALLQAAWRYRERLAGESKLEWHERCAVRLVNGAGDGLSGLAVDRYGPYAFVHVYETSWAGKLPAVHAALLRLPGLRGVYQTDRTRAAGAPAIAEGFVAGAPAPENATVVTEAGLQYEIHLAAGPATGLYLDQRDNRRQVASLAPGGSLLNTFSYTCSFSLAAAAQGAQTTSVDLGRPALETAKRNFVRNGLSIAEHRFVVEDVFVYLPRLARKGESFTAVLLDPPTFARGKKGTFSTEKNYADLTALAAPLVAPGGYLIAFANTHRMSAAAWRAEVRRGLGTLAPDFREAARWTQAPDFTVPPNAPEENYLKSLVLRRR